MMEEFKHLLFHENIADDLERLDGSQLKVILKALKRIEETDGEIGDMLGRRKEINLQGYKKVKLRKHGIRIIFKKINDTIFVAEIIVIGKREELLVYQEAMRRLVARDGE